MLCISFKCKLNKGNHEILTHWKAWNCFLLKPETSSKLIGRENTSAITTDGFEDVCETITVIADKENLTSSHRGANTKEDDRGGSLAFSGKISIRKWAECEDSHQYSHMPRQFHRHLIDFKYLLCNLKKFFFSKMFWSLRIFGDLLFLLPQFRNNCFFDIAWKVTEKKIFASSLPLCAVVLFSSY